jgi:hypothetical protein
MVSLGSVRVQYAGLPVMVLNVNACALIRPDDTTPDAVSIDES